MRIIREHIALDLLESYCHSINEDVTVLVGTVRHLAAGDVSLAKEVELLLLAADAVKRIADRTELVQEWALANGAMRTASPP